MNNGSEGNDERVTKKPRVMAVPDGFTKSTPKGKSKVVKIQDFTSAFDDLKRPSPAKLPSKARASKPLSSTSVKLMANPFVAIDMPPVDQRPGPSRPAKRALATTSLQATISSPSSVDPMRFKPSSVTAREPPSNKPISAGPIKPPRPTTKLIPPATTEDTSRKNLIIPPKMSLDNPRAASTSKQPVISTTMAPPPLPPPKPLPKDTKSLRTISSTRMALATDPTSVDGTAELFSLFLQNRKDSMPNKKDPLAELHRGVNVSPEKQGKGGAKLVRGGLAEQARQAFSKAHTAILLWQRELEHLYRTSPKSLAPDLRLRITHIIHAPKPTPTSFCGFAECSSPDDVVYDRDADAPSSTPFFARTSVPRLVLFSFVPPPLAYTADIGIRTATRFAVGREVLLWKPWQELDVILPEARNTGHETTPRARTVIFCSRFMISD